MKTKFFVSPIGRPIFYKTKHQRSDRLVVGFLIFSAIYFAIHILVRAL